VRLTKLVSLVGSISVVQLGKLVSTDTITF